MRHLTKISTAIAAIGLSSALFMGHSIADTTDSMAKLILSTDTKSKSALSESNNSQNDDSNQNSVINKASIADSTKVRAVTDNAVDNSPTVSSSANDSTTNMNSIGTPTISSSADNEVATKSPVTNGISQQLTGNEKTVSLLNRLLPTIKYSTENLSKTAQQVNNANWKVGTNINRITGTKLQALLNWHQSGVGQVDGYWGKNTQKAMQAFQKSQGLKITKTLNEETWQALIKDPKLNEQPVLVNYILSDNDIYIKTTTIPAGAEEKAKLEGMYYESVIEGLAEKFHMNESYLQSLNPNAAFEAGEVITVYNPGNPSTKPVSRVVADKATETLYTYDDNDNLIASYPTTVGSIATPSPTGTHKVAVKVHEPNYTYTHEDGSKSIIPPGPNNPVGAVWIGLSEPTYGIHGSPDPARISRQASAGCVRLTNWDALALLGTINSDATVEFK